MAIHAQSSCTLSTITDVEAVYTYYYLSDSTITVNEAPKDNINPPGASTITVISDEHSYVWQITEPQLNIQDNIIQTAVGKLYYIECVKFSDESYDWGPLMTSSTYAAAKAAYNLSSQALSQAQIVHEETTLLAGHYKYLQTPSQSGLTPQSANVIEIAQIEQEPEEEGEDPIIIDVSNDPTQWGYNVHIGSNGIKLRKNELTLSDWTEDALTFYLPYSDPQEISTQLTQNGMIVNQGGIINNKLTYFRTLDTRCVPGKTYYSQDIQIIPIDEGEEGQTQVVTSYEPVIAPVDTEIENYYEYGFDERVKLYLSTENYGSNYTINDYQSDKWRQIIGRYFGVTDEGYLYCSGAYINGKLDVIAGSNVYTKNESQAHLIEVANITGADQWKNKYGNYVLTEDELPNENTIYYQAIYDYFPTDTAYDVNKNYYEQHIDEQTQTIIYDRVTTPSETDIERYFEYGITGYKEIDLQPDDNPHTLRLYILDTISESINDYVQTHLSVEEDGMWIRGGYNYSLTTDVEIDPNKIYYTKILGTNNYEKVVNPIIADISTYYEQNEQYKIQINNNGMMVYDPSNNLVSTFGENIEFSSNRRQRIGGENTYIEFNPGNENTNTSESLIINASHLYIGNASVANKFNDLDNKYQNQSDAITDLTNAKDVLEQNVTDILGVTAETEAFQNELKGYIEIDTTDSIVRIGKRQENTEEDTENNNSNSSNTDENTKNSYIEINASNPNNMKISINMDGNEVAYFNNERMYAPSAVVTNLYMKTKTGEGRVVGQMGWLMRSNGHLSLKEIM